MKITKCHTKNNKFHKNNQNFVHKKTHLQLCEFTWKCALKTKLTSSPPLTRPKFASIHGECSLKLSFDAKTTDKIRFAFKQYALTMLTIHAPILGLAKESEHISQMETTPTTTPLSSQYTWHQFFFFIRSDVRWHIAVYGPKRSTKP